MTAPDRPSFALVLQPLPGVDGTRAIKALLKIAGRSPGLRCTSLREIGDDATDLPPPSRRAKAPTFQDQRIPGQGGPGRVNCRPKSAPQME
jgi:hypothetical protein